VDAQRYEALGMGGSAIAALHKNARIKTFAYTFAYSYTKHLAKVIRKCCVSAVAGLPVVPELLTFLYSLPPSILCTSMHV
jgi:hypothetical protein